MSRLVPSLLIMQSWKRSVAGIASTILIGLLSGCSSSDDSNILVTGSSNLALEGRQIAKLGDTGTGVLANPDFSEPLGNLPGWSACVDDNAISIETANRRARVGAGECILQLVDIEPGSSNSISCDVSASNPDIWSGMAISFYDVNGGFISESEAARADSVNATRKTSTGTAPSNANAALVWFYTESGGTIDNCSLVSTPEESNRQTYRKTLEVTTAGNIGFYLVGNGGFGFNGFTAIQYYPARSNDSFLVDGFERQGNDTAWRNWNISLGLAEGYLHVAATIYKYNTDFYGIRFFPASESPPLPLDSPQQIWNDDSMEIYFNIGNESTVGYDDNDFVRIIRFDEPLFYTPDTLTGFNSRLNLSDEAVCGPEEFGAITCEARFSLTEMGVDLSAYGNEVEIGFDVHMNFDDDGGNREAKYSWCSADTVDVWQDMSVVDCSLKLVQDCEYGCAGFGFSGIGDN